MIAKRPLGRSPAGECQRAAIQLASIELIAPTHCPIAGGRSRGNLMRSRILVVLMVLMLAAPAGAVLTDDEPCNDEIAASGGCPSGAPIQMSKTGTVTTDAGEFTLVAGDIDFVGIAALSTGDIVTVTTTPLDDRATTGMLEIPNTMVGLFDSSTTDPTQMILCLGDDTQNNELITKSPMNSEVGLGSLCRFGITTSGNYYVGVTGFRDKDPDGCDPAVPPGCSSFPFDGGIGPIQCQEEAIFGTTQTCGDYQVTIAVHTALPEPGMLLQLVSGGVGLAWLNRRRNRRMTPSSRRLG